MECCLEQGCNPFALCICGESFTEYIADARSADCKPLPVKVDGPEWEYYHEEQNSARVQYCLQSEFDSAYFPDPVVLRVLVNQHQTARWVFHMSSANHVFSSPYTYQFLRHPSAILCAPKELSTWTWWPSRASPCNHVRLCRFESHAQLGPSTLKPARASAPGGDGGGRPFSTLP